MAYEIDESAANQVDSSSLPSYMVAADIHNVANGVPSLMEDSSVYDALTKGTLSAIARGVTSAFNTVPAATNWMGLTDVPEWQTEDLLSKFDDNLAAYYSEHRESIDIVGDVAASFIPGMAAVKGLNYAQKGLSGLNRGSAGRNLLQSIGSLPTKGDDLVAEAIKRVGAENTFSIVDSSVLKAFGTKYAQNALEVGVFELAASASMREYSPIFKDHTATDILYNAALGGGIVGAGLLGSVSAIQTYGVVRKAKDLVDKALNPFRHVAETPEGVDEFVKILNWKHQLDNPPVAASNVETRALETRQRNLGLSMQESFTKVAKGDTEVAAILSKSLEQMTTDQAWAALLHMDETGRAAKTLGTEVKSAELAKLKEQQARFKQGSNEWFALDKKIEAIGEIGTVKYLSVMGDATGQVSHAAPQLLNLADRFDVKTVEGLVSKHKVTPGETWNPVGKDWQEVESRYVQASRMELKKNGTAIGAEDLPLLEAAWNKKVSTVIINGVEYDRIGLWHHLQTTKERLVADALEDAEKFTSTEQIAKTFNVRQALVEGGGYSTDALDTASWIARSDFAENFTKPSVIKVAYKGDPATVGVSGNELQGMVTIKQLQEVQEAENLKAITAVLGEEAVSQLIKLTDRDVLSTTSKGAGAGLFTLASGEYLTTASKVEWLGKVTNKLKVEGQKVVNDTFQPLAHAVLQNPAAGQEIINARQLLMQTGEKYVYRNGEIVHQKVAAHEDGLRKTVPDLPEHIPSRIPLKTTEAQDFMREWVSFNDAYLNKQQILRTAQGRGMEDFTGQVYFPQPDSRKFKYFSFVTPKNPAEGEKIQMLWAASPEDLARLESKVDPAYTILHKTDTERFYKALGQYDHDLGMNSHTIRADMQREGIAAPFFPISDPQKLLQEMIEFRHRVSDQQVRDAITLHNSTAFSELRNLDQQYTAIQRSTKESAAVDSPFGSYVKTALDIPRNSHVPAWTAFNNLAENVYSKVVGKIGESWKKLKNPKELDELNANLNDVGIRGFKDSLTELWANHPADRKILSEHVLTANSILASTILRLDPMNAVNNGVGAMVLTGSETAYLVNKIQKLGGQTAEEFKKLAQIQVPGSEKYITSPTKLIASAYKDFFSVLGKSPEGLALEKKYGDLGLLPSMMDQVRSVVDGATLTGIETSSELAAKTSQMIKAAANMGEKLTGNKMAEEMNRFVAARVSDKISEILVKSGQMTQQEQYAFINTFVNRTQGNYLASQRPLMFQGPIGHAISLFQTYQFNMMQHIFRHVAEGDKKQLAILLGLQTSIYGMNGLPAFQFMNQHLVSNAAGNLEHDDVFSFLKQGGDVGNWLLYGSLSNATGLGLYSRGDLNPRQVTVLPASLGEVPIVSATRNLFGAIARTGEELGEGANVSSTILRGLEHSGISRPLAGIATTLQGLISENGMSYSTSQKNNLMTTWDTYSAASIARMAGARPFEEAVARDAYYRVQSFEAADQKKINTLGSALRDRVRSGEIPTQEEYNQFLESYVRAGGDQKNFIKYWQRQVKSANESQIDQLVGHAKQRYSQYMQTMIGGVE